MRNRRIWKIASGVRHICLVCCEVNGENIIFLSAHWSLVRHTLLAFSLIFSKTSKVSWPTHSQNAAYFLSFPNLTTMAHFSLRLAYLHSDAAVSGALYDTSRIANRNVHDTHNAFMFDTHLPLSKHRWK